MVGRTTKTEKVEQTATPPPSSRGRRLARRLSLGLDVFDGGLDGVLGQHGAVQLDGGQGQVLRDVGVLDRRHVLQRPPLDPLRGHAGRRDGGPAPKRLEAGVDDVAVVVDADLELHHVAARGGADEAGAHVGVVLGEGTHVAGALVVVDDLRGGGEGKGREYATVTKQKEIKMVQSVLFLNRWQSKTFVIVILLYVIKPTRFKKLS